MCQTYGPFQVVLKMLLDIISFQLQIWNTRRDNSSAIQYVESGKLKKPVVTWQWVKKKLRVFLKCLKLWRQLLHTTTLLSLYYLHSLFTFLCDLLSRENYQLRFYRNRTTLFEINLFSAWHGSSHKEVKDRAGSAPFEQKKVIIWKRSFISTVRPTIHTTCNPSLQGSLRTLFSPERNFVFYDVNRTLKNDGLAIIIRFPRFSEKSFVLFIQYPPDGSRDFVARSAASRPNILHPEIHEVDLWQVYRFPWYRPSSVQFSKTNLKWLVRANSSGAYAISFQFSDISQR